MEKTERLDILLTAITTGVSDVEDCPINKLPPLFNSVEPEILGSIVSGLEKSSNLSGVISFEYSKSIVTIEFLDEVYLKIQSKNKSYEESLQRRV